MAWIRGLKIVKFDNPYQNFNLKCLIFGHKWIITHAIDMQGTGIAPWESQYGHPILTVYAICERCNKEVQLAEIEMNTPMDKKIFGAKWVM